MHVPSSPLTVAGMGDILPPKRQAVVERLRRRIEFYRRHQNASFPRYDQAANGLFDQQKHDTLLLKQRYLESKAKKAKKSEHKNTKDTSNSSGNNNNSNGGSGDVAQQRNLLVQQKLKRPSEGSPGVSDESSSQPKEPLPSFSVQIVQQFTSNASPSSSQHSIQTNVTVKAIGAEVECKQERREDHFPCSQDTFAQLGFPEDSNDEDEIHPDILKDLFDDDELFTNHSDLMKDFNFDESVRELDKVLQPPFSPIMQQGLFDGTPQTPFAPQQPRYPAAPSSFADFKLREPSPAAQTLKQMAEQHQNMQQLAMFETRNATPPFNGQKSSFFANSPPDGQQKASSSYAATRPLTHYSEPGTSAAQQQQSPNAPTAQQHFQPQPTGGTSVHMSQSQQIQVQVAPQQHVQVTQGQQMNQEVKAEVVYQRYGQQPPAFQTTQSQSVTFHPQQTPSFGGDIVLRQQQQFVSRPPPEYKTQVVKPQRYQQCGSNTARQVALIPDMLFVQQQQQMAPRPSSKPPVYNSSRAPNVSVGPDGLNIAQRLLGMQQAEWKTRPTLQQQRVQYRTPVQGMQQQVYGNSAAMLGLPRHRQMAPQQQRPLPTLLQQQQQMYVPSQQHQSVTDSSVNFNLDFLDSIDSSASDLLNFDQVMQSGAHFNILEEMGMLGK